MENAVVAIAWGDGGLTAAAGRDGCSPKLPNLAWGDCFWAGGDSNTQAQLYDAVGRRFFIGTTVRLGVR